MKHIQKVIFSETQNILNLIDGKWQAEISWSDGSTQTVYRNAMPATTDKCMSTAGLFYNGHRNGKYIWLRK